MDAKKLYQEMDRHLLEDDNPGEYFNQIDNPLFFSEYPFTMLSRLKKVKQSPVHHPEGSVWNHTILVLDQAAQVKSKSSDSRSFMWGALLHDIGKTETTKIRRGKITSYEHDTIGAKRAKEFLQYFSEDANFIAKVTALVRWHMQILYVVNALPFADIVNMKKQLDPYDIALMGLCDRLGRVGANRKKEEADIQLFLEKIK